jgi:2,3-bisphosphoglycerate-dependent phosphoglycerate mutase
MKYLYLFIFSVFFINPILAQTEVPSEVTTYYFIRHAEKDRSDSANQDPHLTEIGKMRAENWSSIFNNITFNAIYSTNYNRTKETAEPTAIKNKLEVFIYSPKTIELTKFLEETKGKTVLIVGHSNTTPLFVNDILGQKKHDYIDDDNNGNLYIITMINNKMTDQVLYID